MIKKFFGFLLVINFFTLLTQPGLAQPGVSIVPEEELGNKTWAIASHSVINIRSAPAYAAEMTTQALMGTPLKILAKKRGWYQVQMPDGYDGWTSSPLIRIDSVTLHTINKQPRVVVMDNHAFVYSSPKQNEIVAEVMMGNIMKLESNKKKKGFYKVSFVDGRKGYVAANTVKKWEDWRRSIQLTGNSIEQIAKRFIGLPYFWGGTSARGLDCSGLTKTTYFMHGIILPRDARQQYLTGIAVDSTNRFRNLQNGDLLFFGKKYADDSTRYNIVHTAIYLQNSQFIQAGDGSIQISSLNASDSNFDNHNATRYVIAKRILNQPAIGTWSIFEHPWYN